ncbi:polymorphic toxin type 43 domain-containing protein [Duganella guangzhouensis]|uniref:polymorphic toxin type 43 domain-containing protein n=1 Tax=Duganella guangzhouensis TaxID=2666084 RepID=UPI0018A1DA39
MRQRTSGPVAGVIGITDTSSVAALKNYFPRGGVEFVYAPKNNRLAAGKPRRHVQLCGSTHQQLAASIKATPNSVLVGGTLSRDATGALLTSEQSGHYGDKWTPVIRIQFTIWLMARTGLPVIHYYEEQP